MFGIFFEFFRFFLFRTPLVDFYRWPLLIANFWFQYLQFRSFRREWVRYIFFDNASQGLSGGVSFLLDWPLWLKSSLILLEPQELVRDPSTATGQSFMCFAAVKKRIDVFIDILVSLVDWLVTAICCLDPGSDFMVDIATKQPVNL